MTIYVIQWNDFTKVNPSQFQAFDDMKKALAFQSKIREHVTLRPMRIEYVKNKQSIIELINEL